MGGLGGNKGLEVVGLFVCVCVLGRGGVGWWFLCMDIWMDGSIWGGGGREGSYGSVYMRLLTVEI